MALVALGLGYALYRYVELPVRRAPMQLSKKSLGAVVAASIALVLVSIGVTRIFSPAIDYADMRRANRGFGSGCEFEKAFPLAAACSNSKFPKILVWGDSHAMHLVPGIVATTSVGVAQATRSHCGPLDGLAPVDMQGHDQRWARSCLAFNQSVFDYLAQAESVEYVVLASLFAQYLDGTIRVRNANLHRLEGGNLVEVEPSLSLALERLRATVSKLRSLGKKVVVVAPPPSSGFNMGQCLELKASGKLYLGADHDSCRISTTAYHQHQALVRQFLAKVPNEAAVNVVRFDEALCSAQTCETELGGVFVYSDAGHLSIDGSRQLALRMGLANQLLAAAR